MQRSLTCPSQVPVIHYSNERQSWSEELLSIVCLPLLALIIYFPLLCIGHLGDPVHSVARVILNILAGLDSKQRDMLTVAVHGCDQVGVLGMIAGG